MVENLAVREQEFILDDRIRGVPPGTRAFSASSIAERNWRPAEGVMALPVLTLDEAAFEANRDLMIGFLRGRGAEIAPHAKTPMSPELARSLVEAGAWGATVADCRQAAVMLKGGIRRLILANEVGGLAGAKRLAGLISAWPLAELYVFVDSLSGLEALAEAWRGELPPLRILLEVGAGRGGVRTLAEAEEIIDAALNARGLILSGVATYEGAAAQPTAEATEEAVAKVLDFTVEVFREIRARESSPRRLIVTAGGSSFFDRVIDRLGPLAAADGNAALILRSGAIFFHDHGMYDLALARLDQRTPSLLAPTVSARNAFRPALRLWAEVLSRPEDALAICGMGMRDVSFDQGMPIVLRVYRSGSLLAGIPTARLVKLNDQHSFLALEAGADLRVGDVVEFGISHPCTCLDRHRFVFGLDETGRVRRVYPTYFG